MRHKIWAVIPAAGSGSRFSKTELKQYQMIQGQTVLEHTVSRLNDLPLSGYVLAISEDDSVANLSQFASPDDLVFVHDAARPCVTQDCLNHLVNTAIQENCSAILAIPVRDTLKLVEHENNIEKTVSRDYLWQAQTPQISKLGILKHAIEKALQDGITITDEASALEYVGETVQVVQGRSDNIKITYSDDLELAKLILTVQK